MRNILVATLQLAGMQFVIALTAIVRNKTLAMRLGPDGFGVFSQILAAMAVIYVVTKFGLAVGLSRFVAASRTREEKQQYLSSACTLTLTLSVSVLVLYGLFSEALLRQVLGESVPGDVSLALTLAVATVPIEALQNSYLGFLQGELDIKGMASKRAMGILVATVLGVPLVWIFGVVGAALQLLCMSTYITWLLARQCQKLGYAPLRLGWHATSVISLASLGVASLVAGFSHNMVDLSTRTQLIDQLGAKDNGIYQSALALTNQVMSILLGSIGSISLATVSKEASSQAQSAAVHRLLSVTTRLSVVALGVLGLMAGPALTLLFAPEFEVAKNLFPVLIVAEYVRAFVWVIGSPLLAGGRLGIWLVLELILAGMRLWLTMTTLPHLGVMAMVVGYLAAWGLHLILNLVLYTRVMRLELTFRDFFDALFGAVSLVLVGQLGVRGMYLSGGLTILGYAVLAVRRSEWVRLRETAMRWRKAG